MRINQSIKSTPIFTHEGGKATKAPNPLEQLRRTVLATLLWEDNFYEDGQTVAQRITENCAKVSAEDLAALAIEARSHYNLRHVPLHLLIALLDKRDAKNVPETIAAVIQRADEITELLAMFWKDGKRPLPNRLKKGLALALNKFDAYALGKYNRNTAIKLRDVIRLVHPKAKDEAQGELFRKIVKDELEIPQTWEMRLQRGEKHKEVFEDLLKRRELGYLALLRNLRLMTQHSVDTSLISEALRDRKGARRVLPFRYIAAARHCPSMAMDIDAAMQLSLIDLPKLSGKTVVLVDVSSSMHDRLSGESELSRSDAACGLASIVSAEHLRIFSFSHGLVECPNYRGLANIEAIKTSQCNGGTYLAQAMGNLEKVVGSIDRLIIITDEQSADGRMPNFPATHKYLINVANYQNGIGYGEYTTISGFSENVIRFIYESENVSAR